MRVSGCSYISGRRQGDAAYTQLILYLTIYNQMWIGGVRATWTDWQPASTRGSNRYLRVPTVVSSFGKYELSFRRIFNFVGQMSTGLVNSSAYVTFLYVCHMHLVLHLPLFLLCTLCVYILTGNTVFYLRLHACALSPPRLTASPNCDGTQTRYCLLPQRLSSRWRHTRRLFLLHT